MAAPTMLPATRITPRDNAVASEARVTWKAVIPAHQGLSECTASAAGTASVTDNAASSASKPRGPREDGTEPLVESKYGHALVPSRRCHRVGQGNRRFADPGAADQQHAGSALDAAAEQCVEFGGTGRCEFTEKRLVVLHPQRQRHAGSADVG